MDIAKMIEETLRELDSPDETARPLTDQKIETLMASVGPEVRLIEEWDHEWKRRYASSRRANSRMSRLKNTFRRLFRPTRGNHGP